MKVQKRSALAALLALLLVVTTAGVASAQVTLTVNTFSTYPAMHEWLEWVTEKYMEENPDIKVEWIHARGDDLTTMLIAGVGPDLIHLGQNWGDQIRWLADLSDYLARNPQLTSDLIPGLRGLFEFQGGTWAIPFSASTWGMAVNENLLAEHGFQPPTVDWTWTEALEMMRTVTRDSDGDGAPDTWGVALWWQPWNLLAYGGSLYTEDGRNSNISNSARLKAIDLYTGIYSGREGIMPSGYAGYPLNATDLFNAGTLGFLEMGIFQIPGYRDTVTYDWSVQHYPKLEHDGQLLTGGSYTLEGYGVNKDTPHFDEALRLLEFMYEYENLAPLLRKGAIMPPTMSLVGDFLAINDRPRNVQIYLEALDFHQQPSNNPAFGAVFGSMWPNIWNSNRGHDGSVPPEYLMEESHQLTQRALDEFYSQWE